MTKEGLTGLTVPDGGSPSWGSSRYCGSRSRRLRAHILNQKHEAKRAKVGMERVAAKLSKPASGDKLPPARSRFLCLPKQLHQLGIKYPNA